MSLIKLTLKSIVSRKLISLLLILSIGLSTSLLIGVQKIKYSAKKSFSHSISGTDLIAGSRSGDLQLLLYTVFRHGQPVSGMSWESIKTISSFSEVKWIVPMSLGDSHRGYPVVGTSLAYFDHYHYGKKQSLRFKQGSAFNNTFDAVLGSEVAKHYNYSLNDMLTLSHGIAKGNLPLHKNNLFNVVGILEATGTPVDKTVHIPLEGITALHIPPNKRNNINQLDLTPISVTSCLIGLKSKFSIFSIQQRINNWSKEPLMAIIPGVSLSRLWSIISTVDSAFLIITILVTIIAFIGLLLSLFMSLQQRKRELAILRIMGAHPLQLAMMLTLESLFITISGVILGIVLVMSVGIFLTPILEEKMGLILSLTQLSFNELYLSLGIILFGLLTSFIPAFLAYRKSLSEGFISI